MLDCLAAATAHNLLDEGFLIVDLDVPGQLSEIIDSPMPCVLVQLEQLGSGLCCRGEECMRGGRGRGLKGGGDDGGEMSGGVNDDRGGVSVRRSE